METRWFRRLSPGVAALGAVAAIASTTAGATPPTWDPPDCPGSPAVGGVGVAAWFRLDPTLVDGTYVGQRLTLGRADSSTTWRMELGAESFAAEPEGETVLVGTDDGRVSHLSLLDLAAACRWTVGASRDVVRAAVMHPDGRSIVESRVDRRTRADIGVWRRPLDGGESTTLLPPLPADARFGPTWITLLGRTTDGDGVVVGSCGEVACRYRVLPMTRGLLMTISDPGVGSLVGLADGRLVAHRACRGLPCPLVSVDLTSGDEIDLDPAAGAAVLARDEGGRSVVVHEIGEGTLRAIRPDGSDAHDLPAPPDGVSLVAGAAWSASAAEHPADRLLFAPDGRLPLDGLRGALLRSIEADDASPLTEVIP